MTRIARVLFATVVTLGVLAPTAAMARPVADAPTTYCGPSLHWSAGHCVRTVPAPPPGRRAI